MVDHWSLKKLTLVILGLSLSWMTHAGIIVEQALNTTDNYGFLSNTGAGVTADNFSLSSETNLQSITWYGSYFDQINNPGPTLDTFEVSIFDSLNNPATFSLSSTSVSRSALSPSVNDAFGMVIYEYELSLSGGLSLNAGDYLLSISNSNTDFLDWVWSDSVSGLDGVVYYRDNVAVWEEDFFGNPDALDAAFVLSGEPVASVPEPATPLLLLSGILVLLFSKRKRL